MLLSGGLASTSTDISAVKETSNSAPEAIAWFYLDTAGLKNKITLRIWKAFYNFSSVLEKEQLFFRYPFSYQKSRQGWCCHLPQPHFISIAREEWSVCPSWLGWDLLQLVCFAQVLRRSLLFLALSVPDCTRIGELYLFALSQPRGQVEGEEKNVFYILILGWKAIVIVHTNKAKSGSCEVSCQNSCCD